MKLSYLLHGLELKSQFNQLTSDVNIQGISDNSQNISEGDLFVAVKGFEKDGHDFLDLAIKKGAVAVVGEQPITNLPVPYLLVESSRKSLGIIARNFYGNPAKHKTVIGITGTNGKTTTCYMLKHMLESNGKTCSVFGTLQNIVNGERIQSAHTTPNPLVLHKLLSMSKDDVIIMEVSSHALSQHRIEGIEFDYCLFSNLHPEHLDYHSTIEEYFSIKLLLFNQLKIHGKAIVNKDNPWGMKLTKILRNRGKTVYTIGESEENHLRISSLHSQKSSALIEEDNEYRTIHSPMNGIHNVYNTLMAYMTSKLVGINPNDILKSTGEFKGVEGRFEAYPLLNGATVIVDYAHTPDAISYCLTTAKQQGAKRIIHIFGFRGDRDSSKRQTMLSLTTDLSDKYVLTLDDLNSVSSDEMIKTLSNLQDTYGSEKGSIIPDRTLAIKYAIEDSQSGDWIVITGKGHEKYRQNFKLPTASDRETINFITKLK
ncbi:UDP-N-acetylmuramoyl-L-alanyl-D-glutamate--2,6-diaminopimelate ligase [Planococcus sp. ISL-110]|uniref:UDP-N-acetylmuramoyl-L-alanyl-D-glutamate--2, 6-diaminopimelate ligase n=1 Tax=Planococcus sp. ISL-110 TaxID=2819167 RepID=UPI001BECCD6E|nr:UDP-N-acetylmuramoyl-L-alanyl-D-glutamate--2,6-diaminopimelate ligase [Planococcus sp. ISL-110]MBT2571590.1 UDP-N-acetylmuramoyl-L-alanyl-D-glutamate--2,6-diaminopimelate ligase [Planococcus sp. ISL-110]